MADIFGTMATASRVAEKKKTKLCFWVMHLLSHVYWKMDAPLLHGRDNHINACFLDENGIVSVVKHLICSHTIHISYRHILNTFLCYHQ